jgi:adenylate cyclase
MGAAHRSKGEFKEGLAACEVALRLDPKSYVGNRIAGLCCVGLHRYDDAIRHFELAAEVMETEFTALTQMANCYKAKGDIERMRSSARKAQDRIEKMVVAEPGHSRAIGLGVAMLAMLNEKERAREWAIRARLVDPENVNLHYNLACAMCSLGDAHLALETLEDMAPRLSSGMLSWMEADPDLDPIRGEARFKSLVERTKVRFAKT